MLHQLDEALEEMLRHRLPLGRDQIDISFKTPDAAWGSTVSTPTLNLFLWDIRRSADEALAGRVPEEVAPGRRAWRQRAPRFEFQYLLTAWTMDDVVDDEHQLLGLSLAAILGCPSLEGTESPGFVTEEEPAPTVRVARSDSKDLAEFWGAIDGKLKPGLHLVVSASIEPARIVLPADGVPDAKSVHLKSWSSPWADLDPDARRGRRERTGGSERRSFAGESAAIGATVRSPRGTAVVSEMGRYVVEAMPGDLIVIEAEPEETVTVPEDRLQTSEASDE